MIRERTITLCPNASCTKKTECYRSPSSGTYADAPNQHFCDFLFGKTVCEAFIPVRGEAPKPTQAPDMYQGRAMRAKRR